MIEEQHVTQYGALLDPTATWFECLLMHQYTECYLYWSYMQTETNPKLVKVWERLMNQEIAHVHMAAQLLEKHEGKIHRHVVGAGDFPDPVELCSNIEYVRSVLNDTVEQTAILEDYCALDNLPSNAAFYKYQEQVNHELQQVESHNVIEDYIRKFGQDYRWETAPNPVQALKDRTRDNVSVGRVAQAAH